MATYSEAAIIQSTPEIRKWVVDFTDDLLSGVTVSSATATHTPPSGAAATPTVAVSTPNVTVQIGPLAVTGVHYLDVLATLSNGEKAEVRIAFGVGYPSTAARAGMLTLITQLRQMTEAGPADYVLAGVPYWSDAQLQAVLDAHRLDFTREPLRAEIEFVAAGEAEFHDYYTERRYLEEAASGAASWDVEDGQGDTLGTADYSVNYAAGHIRVTADTEGAPLYLTGRAFNLKRAAADVWERKAAHAAQGYFFQADGASFHREQVYEHCMKMAQHYREQGGVKVGRLFRSDGA